MSASTHPPNTHTLPQQNLSFRGAIPIPERRSRNYHTNMNGDYHYDPDLRGIDNSDEYDQSHPYGKTGVRQGKKRHTYQPIELQVGDVEEVASRHSIDYRGRPRHEDNNSSESSSSARSNTITTSSTRAAGNSQVRPTLSASPDATRLRHVPRGPVARVRPTTPPTIKSSRSQSPQNTSVHSKSISDALMSGTQTGCAILGIGVGVDVVGLTGASQTKLDIPYDRTEQPSHVAGPRCNTSPAISNTKAKQEDPISRSPHDNTSSTPIRRFASPPRDINKPLICSKDEMRLCSSSASTGSLESDKSATVSYSKVEQGNSDSNRSAMERKARLIVRPLPALPGEILNGTGSASKTGTEKPVRDLSSPPSLTAPSNDSLTPAHKMDATKLCSTNKNNIGMASRAATISRSPTSFNSKLRCTPQGTNSMITNDKDQSEDDTPTPTVPFPTPRRSMTTGILPLSRDTKPPPLSIPPLNRCLSFKGITEGARLSPSVIIRPPPLPLVNLPVLPSATRVHAAGAEGSEGGNGQDERRRSRLMMSMPALPLQGSSRGTRGHEEVDDLEEEDEEEEGEEDEVDEANDISGRSSASSSSRIETPRSSFDSQTSLDEAGGDDLVEKLSATSHSSRTLSSISSYETARAEPSPSFGESYRWDADHVGVVKGKAKQELGDEEGLVGDVVFPTMKDLAGLSNSKGRGDRGVEVSGLKVVATSDVKVARSYGSERLVLEERVGSGSGSAGRTRSNPNNPGPSNGGPPRHLPPEPLRAARLTTLPAEGSMLGNLHPGDRSMGSKNCLLSVSTTPLGSPKLGELKPLGIGHHNKMYKRASTSLVDVRSIGTKERVERMVRDQEEEDRKRSSRILKVGVSSRKGNESAVSKAKGKRSEVGKGSVGPSEPKTLIPENDTLSSGKRDEKTTVAGGVSEETATPRESSIHPLRRRRSVPTTNPPSYSSLFTGIPPGLGMELKVQPREDEGKEKLPSYTNDIFLKAIMPRKMEFTSPGVQAKDRKWRHVLCVLEGTALRVYKCSPSGSVSAWWEHKVGAGDPLMDAVPSSSGARSTSAGRAGDKREPASALTREIELARAKKSGKVVQPLLRIDNNPVDRSQELRSISPLPKPQGQIHQQQQSSGSHGVTKSAFTFAAQLLKPSVTKHSRSNSEVSHTSEPSTSSSLTRSSSSLPRDSTTAQTNSDGSGSVQSHLPATVSTHLTIPGRQSNRSRPLTPMSNGRPDQTKSSQSSDSSSKKRAEQGAELGGNDLIRVYTMQNAESGLGKDYTKRQHVIRVRLEGEQFLLQAKNVESVIAWIEGLQCAANVALDLDERPMPTGPLLPRRRRRRRTAATAAVVASSNS